MASIAARNTARQVIETARKGKRPIIYKIAMQNGYTKNSAMTNRPQNTKSYQAEIAPYVEKLTRERDRILDAMSRKDLGEEEYKTLSSSLASATHDIQLLSGGKTENVGVEEDRRILLGIVAQLRGSEDKMLE